MSQLNLPLSLPWRAWPLPLLPWYLSIGTDQIRLGKDSGNLLADLCSMVLVDRNLEATHQVQELQEKIEVQWERDRMRSTMRDTCLF